MSPTQSRMARNALRLSLTEFAAIAGVGRATVARFEAGTPVAEDSIQAMQKALEGAGARFGHKAGRVGVTVPE